MLKDRFGNEIKPGVLVTFPTRVSSSLWMVDGRVAEITERKNWRGELLTRVHIRRPDDKVTFTEIIERLTVVAESI
jgi:hypothetical protein